MNYNTKFLVLLFLLIISKSIISNDLKDIYKNKFPNESFVNTSIFYEISFIQDKKGLKNNSLLNEDKEVYAVTNIEVDAFSLKNEIYSENLFYSEIEEIKKIKVHNGNFEKRYYSTHYATDQAYEDNNLFHTDYRIKNLTITPVSIFTKFGYKYQKITHDLKYLERFFFNDYYFTEKSTIKIIIPTWLDLEILEVNFEGYSIEKKISTLKDGSKEIIYNSLNNNFLRTKKNELSVSKIFPHLIFVCKKYKDLESQNVINILSNTSDLYDWYRFLTKNLNYNNSNIEKISKSITDTCKTHEDKLKAIYYWIQKNIKYIAFEDGITGFKPDEAANVLEKRYGDCKGMANLTKAMLKSIGIDARLAWIGTQDIPYTYNMKTLYVDNHMICVVFLNNKTYFIDGTEKFQHLDNNAYRLRDKEVMVENEENFIILRVPKSIEGEDKQIRTFKLKIDNNNLVGYSDIDFFGDSKNSYLYYKLYLEKSNEKKLKSIFLSLSKENVLIGNVNCNDCNFGKEKISLKHDIEVRESVMNYENKIYINLDFNNQILNQKFDNTYNGLDFKESVFYQTTSELEIPNQFKILEIPQNYSFKNEQFEVNIKYDIKKNIIVLNKTINIPSGKINKEKLNDFLNTIETLNKLKNDVIILQKN